MASLDRNEVFKDIEVLNFGKFCKSSIDQLKFYDRILMSYSFMSHQKEQVYKEWKVLKNSFKTDKLLIIAGGPHPSAMPKESLKYGADLVCCYDGEEVFPEAVSSFLKGELEPSRILYKRSRLWEYDFPFPVKNPLISPIEITRGCPFGCKYCQTPVLKGRRIRHKSMEVILEAVKFMVKHNVKDIRFISSNALSYGSKDGKKLNIRKIEDFLLGIRQVLPRDGRIFFGSFPSEVRPEFLTPDVVKLIKRLCANKRVVFGAQSGSPRMLEKIRREHSVEHVLCAVDILRGYDIEPVVDFIIGFPEESDEDLILTLNLMEDLIQMGARIHLHYFMPLPGSPWAYKKPTRISEWAIKRINGLISRGKLFGHWMNQIKIAQRLYEGKKV